MKGLELAECYYREYCAPMLQKNFPELVPRIAAGLAGEGSECLGFDDDISRDHDWGPSVCLWLTEADFSTFGPRLAEALQKIPVRQVCGFSLRQSSEWGEGRTGVLCTPYFYYRYLGRSTPPETPSEWIQLPEERLATAANGKVFFDPLGEFTAFRTRLLAFYPEDVRLKKMACRLAKMAQAGQYNYPRSLARSDRTAAYLAMSEFIRAAVSLVHLLNKKYTPYYKWMYRSLRGLPLAGADAARLVLQIVNPPAGVDAFDNGYSKMNELCALVLHTIRTEGLAEGESSFLLDTGVELQKRIQDPLIRNLDLLVG